MDAENRIHRLERSNRALWGALILCLAPFLAGAVSQDDGTVRVTRLVVQDAEGRIRGYWGLNDQGEMVLAQLDEHGREGAWIKTGTGGYEGTWASEVVVQGVTHGNGFEPEGHFLRLNHKYVPTIEFVRSGKIVHRMNPGGPADK